MQISDTMDKLMCVETLNPDLVLIYQTHKRWWPFAQRESLFWSHRSEVSEHRDPDAMDAWMVTNQNIELEDVPVRC